MAAPELATLGVARAAARLRGGSGKKHCRMVGPLRAMREAIGPRYLVPVKPKSVESEVDGKKSDDCAAAVCLVEATAYFDAVEVSADSSGCHRGEP